MNANQYIRFDWAAKRLLRQKANFVVLEGFLTTLLKETIEIVEILESEANQEDPTDKFNRVDIKARNSKGEIVIIEIQNTRELYYLERILFGVAKAITEHIDLGQDYSHIKKIYSVSIVYFDLGKGNDYIYHGQTSFEGLNTGDRLELTAKENNAIVRKPPEKIFPEYFIIRVNEFDRMAVTPLEEWVQYLKTGIIEPDWNAPGLPEARQRLKYYEMSEAERLSYERHLDTLRIQYDVIGTAKLEGWTEGKEIGWIKGNEEGWIKGNEEGWIKGNEEGRLCGKEEGKAEEKITIAKRMKAEGIPFELITKTTGLSLQQIDGL